MTAPKARNLLAASLAVALLGTTAACGTDETTPAGTQPGSTQPTSTTPASTTTPDPSTPSTPSVPTVPTGSGTPSMDCPDTVSTVRAAVQKAVWGKGAAKSLFEPVGVTICRYDAAARGNAYASESTKRSGGQARELLDQVNAGKVAATKPRFCTADIGPLYVLRFTDNDRGVLSLAAEAFGCHQLVAISFEGQGKPGELPAPRQAPPALTRSLGLR